jgi:hypothetical protein
MLTQTEILLPGWDIKGFRGSGFHGEYKKGDQRTCDHLAEKGINIPSRTVAKFGSELGIAPAGQRTE